MAMATEEPQADSPRSSMSVFDELESAVRAHREARNRLRNARVALDVAERVLTSARQEFAAACGNYDANAACVSAAVARAASGID